MASQPAAADLVAVAELQALFHKADPARTGRLSYSDFALVILRSGGTQAQVDALIEQFAAPSRAQRVVHYEALLHQLYVSSASSSEAAAAAATQQRRAAAAEEEGWRERSASYRRTPSAPTHDALDHSPLPIPPAGVPPYSIHDTRHAAAATTHSPLLRSVTHAGGAGSRERTSSASLLSASHFVASALRAASATRPAAAPPSARAPPPPPPPPSSSTAAASMAQYPAVAGPQRHWLDSVSASPSASRSHSRDGAHRSAVTATTASAAAARRDRSVERMTRAAAAAAAAVVGSGRGAPRVPGTESETAAAAVVRRAPDASSQTSAVASHTAGLWRHGQPSPPPSTSHVHVKESSTVSSSAYAHHDTSIVQRTQQSTLAATPVSLLSLRDIFQRHLAPAATASRSSSASANASTAGESTVLLSALEETLVARGVEVHPLELEAVADSLEPSAVSPAAGASLLPERSGLDITNASSAASTRTGGADRALTLVDFCVLVSRLRPALIRHIRSPAVWATGVESASRAAVWRVNSRVSEGNTKHAQDNDEDDDEYGDGASIMDVTVSPMTSATASPSPLRRRPARTRDALQQQPQHQPQSGPPGTPPTARQLSSDRHFSVRLETPPHEPSRAEASRARAGRGDDDDDGARVHVSAGYAQPTASSRQRRPTAAVAAPQQQQQQQQPPRRALSPPARTVAAVASQPKPFRAHAAAAAARAPGPGGRSPSSGSPLSSTSRSPPSQPPASARAATLTPRVLEELQGAALRLLRRCTQEDPRHTGRMPFTAWARVLRDVCPAWTAAERQETLAWMWQRRGAGQDDAHDCDYAALVEDVLVEASVQAGTPASTASASPRAVGDGRGGAAPRRRPASLSPLSTATTGTDGVSPTPTRSTTRSTTPGTPPTSSRTNTTRAIADELMAVCGGDTAALREYFRAFDARHTGLLDEHVWRASLEELYRRTVGAEVPAWVLRGCRRLARAPFTASAPPSPSPALAAARARAAARVPSATRQTLCDYRYALEELGLGSRSR